MPIRPIRRLPLLCSIWLLTSCAAAVNPPPEVRTVVVPPPAPLLAPPARPVLPARGVPLTQGRVAELLLQYDTALTAAIEQLGAIARLYPIPPAASGQAPE